MKIEIISRTVDNLELNSNERDKMSPEGFLTLGGREAGICYMADNYFSEKIQNSEAALKRANTIIGTGHHSPFDHASIGLEISGIPKIVAMILNSTEFYTTSEKSARYTVMKPDTELEQETYDKWRGIFTDKIKELNIKATDKEIDKLAIENARYMLRVFTPTSMGFTTTFRQYNYLAQWLYKMIDEINQLPESNLFYTRLLPYLKELADFFNNMTGGTISDHKNGHIQFMPFVRGYDIPMTEHIGDVYQINYLASFAQLAQEHRHRTLHYEMMFNGKPGAYGCYTPKIIRGTELEVKWKKDFDLLADQYPQCTNVKVLEQGRAYWFFAKCKERLCGRAQLEICEQTVETMSRFIQNRDRLSKELQDMLDSITEDRKVVPKCRFKGYTCKEPCRWGSAHGIDRLI